VQTVWDDSEDRTMTDKPNIHALRIQAKLKEKELFALRRQIEDDKRTIHGKIIIDPPNEYNCKTCYNKSCIFNPSMFRQKEFVASIRAFTVLYGCLSWLPEKDINTYGSINSCNTGVSEK
jgi:hypothetical protein